MATEKERQYLNCAVTETSKLVYWYVFHLRRGVHMHVFETVLVYVIAWAYVCVCVCKGGWGSSLSSMSKRQIPKLKPLKANRSMGFSIKIQFLTYIYIFKAFSTGTSSVCCLRQQHFHMPLQELSELYAFLSLKEGHHKKRDCVFHKSVSDRIVYLLYLRHCTNLFRHTYQDKHNWNISILRRNV